MRRLRAPTLFIAVVGLVFVGLAISFDRQALAVGSQIRTFVASTGSDANPCSRTAPCRTFAVALVQTASGGEVVALDTGGYGTLTINQSVTITAAPGVQAFIAPSSGTAIEVNAGPADVIILRNLQLNSQGASYGVLWEAGGSLHIENLTVNGFNTVGISASLLNNAELFVADTVLRHNNSAAISLNCASCTLRAAISRVRAEGNGDGITVGDNAFATVKDTIASGGSYGFHASSYAGSSDLNLERCIATNNIGGFRAESSFSTAIIRVSNCVVAHNGTGVSAGTNGTTLSRGNNTVEANTSNGTFTTSYAAK
jgi:hypothetical protein